MTERVKNLLAMWLERYEGKTISRIPPYIATEDDMIARSTVIEYIAFEKFVKRHYYTMEYIVKKLNACAGNDCYNRNWEYHIDEDGRIYSDEVLGYKVLGWKE